MEWIWSGVSVTIESKSEAGADSLQNTEWGGDIAVTPLHSPISSRVPSCGDGDNLMFPKHS